MLLFGATGRFGGDDRLLLFGATGRFGGDDRLLLFGAKGRFGRDESGYFALAGSDLLPWSRLRMNPSNISSDHIGVL